MTFERFVSIGSLIAAVMPTVAILITYWLTHRKIKEVHELVNGQAEALRTAAYSEGVTDEKTDARNVTQLARDLAADAANKPGQP
jgi:hypothetical protein